MKNLKKIILSVVAVAVMTVAAIQPAFALEYGAEWAGYEQESQQLYSDVPVDHWAYDAIARSTAKNWFKGYEDGTFHPNQSISRAEGLTVFVQFLGLQLKTVTETSYYDVPANKWYAPYVEAGKKLYIERAAFNGNVPFNPDMPLTREDAIHALVIALKYNNEVTFADQSVLNMFKDSNSISADLKPYVAVAVTKKLVSGMGDGTIGAQDPLTRAQFATLLYRASTVGFGTGGGLADVVEPEPEVGVASIAVNPTTKSINVGESFAVTATATMTDGTTNDVTSTLVMSSDNSNVTIQGNTVTGAHAGSSVISFTGNELLLNTKINVTVNATQNTQENGTINGKVAYAATPDVGIAGAQVKLTKNGTEVASAVTDENGNYNVNVPVGAYRIVASFSGYTDGQVNAEVIANQTTYAETIYLTNDSQGSVTGKVYDAFVQDGIIEGASISFRAGGDTREGEIVQTAVSSADGSFSVNLPAGTYTAEASKEGYITAYVNVVSQTAAIQQDITLTPVLNDGEWRFVLTWGEHPYDLDSHLTGPSANGRFHVFYYDKTASESGEKLADLDVDDITSYGPETVTIYSYKPGVYRYSVHDYTNRGASGSYKMSNSGAVVKVYNGDRLVKTFNMPTNVAGTVWTVFELDNNNITPINEIYEESNPGAIASVEDSDLDIIKNVVEK